MRHKKRLAILFGIVAIMGTAFYLTPDSANTNDSGAGDIWWVEIPSINDTYKKLD